MIVVGLFTQSIQSEDFWEIEYSASDTGGCIEPSAYPCFTRVHPWLKKVAPQIGTDRTRIIDCPRLERLLECGLIARRKTDKVSGYPSTVCNLRSFRDQLAT
jgi:hypothetical protein